MGNQVIWFIFYNTSLVVVCRIDHGEQEYRWKDIGRPALVTWLGKMSRYHERQDFNVE